MSFDTDLHVAAGLVALAQVWPQPLGIGATSFAIGAALGVVFLVTRAAIDVDVAHLAAAGGPVPDDFERWQRFTGVPGGRGRSGSAPRSNRRSWCISLR